MVVRGGEVRGEVGEEESAGGEEVGPGCGGYQSRDLCAGNGSRPPRVVRGMDRGRGSTHGRGVSPSDARSLLPPASATTPSSAFSPASTPRSAQMLSNSRSAVASILLRTCAHTLCRSCGVCCAGVGKQAEKEA